MITTGCGDFLEIRRQSGNLTPAFTASLSRTIAASVTGFGFPFHHLLPAHVVRHLISGSACDCDLCTLRVPDGCFRNRPFGDLLRFFGFQRALVCAKIEDEDEFEEDWNQEARSPSDGSTIPKELPAQRLRCGSCQPYRSISTFFDRPGGISAAHIGAHPPRTHRINRDSFRTKRLIEHDRHAVQCQLRQTVAWNLVGKTADFAIPA